MEIGQYAISITGLLEPRPKMFADNEPQRDMFVINYFLSVRLFTTLKSKKYEIACKLRLTLKMTRSYIVRKGTNCFCYLYSSMQQQYELVRAWNPLNSVGGGIYIFKTSISSRQKKRLEGSHLHYVESSLLFPS